MNKRKPHLLLPLAFIIIIAVILGINILKDPCIQNGHTWRAATCTTAKYCSVCGKISGEPDPDNHAWTSATCTTPKTCGRCHKTLGEPLSATKEHTWQPATCSSPQKCSVCGETTGTKLLHKYSNTGICSLCGATKEYSNTYGYFSKLELYEMAKNAIKDFCYPIYVYNFCNNTDINIEKITDERLEYGKNCFSIVGTADFSSGGQVTTRGYVVVIEPHTNSTYKFVDAYIQ